MDSDDVALLCYNITSMVVYSDDVEFKFSDFAYTQMFPVSFLIHAEFSHIVPSQGVTVMSLMYDKIDYFSKSEIKVGGETYNNDIIVCPDKTVNWRRSHPTSLSINDFQAVISERPAFLIIGNGLHNNLQIDDFTRTRLNDLGFEVFVAKTRSAIKKYNNTCKDKKTIGLFHIE